MELKKIEKKLNKVIKTYSQIYGIDLNSDYYMMKIQEELGELASAYLRLTGRARQKNKTEKELRLNLEEEIADVLAMTLLFSKKMNIDIEKALDKKWFKYLK